MGRNRSNHLRVILRITGGASMHPVLYLEGRIAGEDGAGPSFRITRGVTEPPVFATSQALSGDCNGRELTSRRELSSCIYT